MTAPRQPMLHLEEVDPLPPTAATYIDYSVTNSILSGLLVGVLAAWGMVMFNRLWQSTLQAEAQEALARATDRGLKVQPPGLRARVVAEGSVGSERVRVEWRGGWRGPHTVVLRGDLREQRPFAADARSVDALLAGTPEPTATPPAP